MAEDAKQLREPPPPPARVIAGCFAMCAFAVAVICGVFADNAVSVILSRAIVSLFGGFVLGLIAGELLAFTIRDHLRHYVLEHPIPDSDVSLDDLIGELRVDKLSESKPNITDKAADA